MTHKLSLLTAALCMTSAVAEDYELKKGIFEQTVKIQGLAVSDASAEISISPKVWGDFIVEKLLPQGSKVKKGDQIVWIDTEKIDEYIEDKELERKIDLIKLQKSKQELVELRLKTERDLLVAKRKFERELENYSYYTKIELPQTVAATKLGAERSQWGLDYTNEELTQLLKMYEADGLTEDTEEIIVQRAKNSVKSATFNNASKQKQVKRALGTQIPRQKVDRELRHAIAKSSWEFAQVNIPRALKRKELELAQLLRQDKKKAEVLKEVKADRATMNLKSPASGVLYYGNFVSNGWSRELAKKTLKRGAKLPQKRTFMTIVPEGNANQLVASVNGFVAERLSKGDTGLMKLPSQPWKNYSCEVVSVSSAPNIKGQWDVVLSTQLAKNASLVVGERVQAKFVSYRKEKALSVPTKAVTENSDGSFSVQLKEGENSEKTVTITTGQLSNDKLEVIDGLSAGQVIIYNIK